MKEFLIQENDAHQRIDKFISKSTTIPKSMMYRLIRQKKIKVNRKRCEPQQILNVSDTVQMFVADEFFISKEIQIKASKLKKIVYEDENLLILDKETGIPVHADKNHSNDTLMDQILKYLVDSGQYDPSKEASFVPALANRLDTNTGGLIIACKNAEALRTMNEMIRCHQVEKHYVCIIEGQIKEGRYDHFYMKDKNQNKAYIYDDKKEGTVPVSLVVTPLHQGHCYSLLDIHLITGKSHQIRAQLAHLGHPLIGDIKYHGKKIGSHQALYAYKLSFHSKNEHFMYLNSLEFIQKNNFVIDQFKSLEHIEAFKN